MNKLVSCHRHYVNYNTFDDGVHSWRNIHSCYCRCCRDNKTLILIRFGGKFTPHYFNVVCCQRNIKTTCHQILMSISGIKPVVNVKNIFWGNLDFPLSCKRRVHFKCDKQFLSFFEFSLKIALFSFVCAVQNKLF